MAVVGLADFSPRQRTPTPCFSACLMSPNEAWPPQTSSIPIPNDPEMRDMGSWVSLKDVDVRVDLEVIYRGRFKFSVIDVSMKSTSK